MRTTITKWLPGPWQRKAKLFATAFILSGSATALAQSITTFSSSGSFTVPAGVTSLTVECWGAGGGGGGTALNPSKGGGGGGGAYARSIISTTPGTVYTITVGAGGTAGSNAGGTGGTGGTSSFSTLVLAPGGNGGVGGVTGTPNGTGGLGASGATGSAIFNGGNGADAAAAYSGAGGSSAGTAANGNNAVGSTAGAAVAGGGAGAAGRTAAAAGIAGTAPGGGGSGGFRNSTTTRAGGAGGAGRVAISYTCPAASGLPYTMPISTALVPSLPTCTSMENTNADANTWRSYASTSTPGFSGPVLAYPYNTTNAANDWLFTQGLTLTAGVSYRLSFNYCNDGTTAADAPDYYPEKLKVMYGSNPNSAAMTLPLADYPTVAAITAQSAAIDFMPPSTGTYYIGFQAYSAADQDLLQLNNIIVDLTASSANDQPSGAITLNVGAGCTGAPYSNASATHSAGEPFSSCSAVTGTHTVWFKFAAPPSGAVRVSTDIIAGGTLTDTRLGLFSATDPSDYASFSIISCDEDGGSVLINSDPADPGTYASVLYATGLTPGQTYYVEVDGFSAAFTGTFCVAVDDLSNTMLATSATCTSAVQIPEATTGAPAYTGWVPLMDANSKLIALVRNPAGSSVGGYTPAQNINSGAIRQDANGLKYLDRNFRIANTTAGNYDVQLFMLSAEQAALQAADPTATLSGLNITRVTGETSCSVNGSGTASLITQTGNGTANGVSWIQFSTPGFSNFFVNAGTTPLPVQLKNFSGKNANAVNNLNWETAQEKNFSHFELQRSADGIRFSRIATVHSNRNTAGDRYAYTDVQPFEGLNIYRLNMVDLDGKATLSDVVKLIVKPGDGLLLNVHPNPVQQLLHITLAGKMDGKGQIEILDIMGKVLQTINVADNNTTVDMHGFATGTYVIRYTDNSHNTVLKISKH